MVNAFEVNKEDYFKESKKLIQVVMDREEYASKRVTAKEELELVRQQQEETKSPDEYEELAKRKKELELKIRFNNFREPAIPVEHQKTAQRNVTVEQLEATERLNELKAQLNERIEYVESDLMPLLKGIRELESMMKIPDQIEAMITSEIGEGVPIPLYARMRMYARSHNETKSGQAYNHLLSLSKALREIRVPVETKGIMSFLKRGKK